MLEVKLKNVNPVAFFKKKHHFAIQSWCFLTIEFIILSHILNKTHIDKIQDGHFKHTNTSR